ncbi:hypothetical protein [Sphingomonas sp. CARO-RG-8B-R24-01]|uniref:hypothetical protein n=1 Tax=Sphingomonas sp. CARO-RG-8B-R24-01 TaxID=2914831 RepID=UPI001F56FE2F|nr:hypothetical protein [Sphingomonas sp. CARO-RG-8B-R24-01]
MNKDGLAQAQERLAKLRFTAAIVTSDATTGERESAWLDFIQYHGTIYSKLQQASKADPKSKLWFEGKQAERKSDELLRYLHHARNAAEHTIIRSSSQADFSISGYVGAGIDSNVSLGIGYDHLGRPYGITQGLGNIQVHQHEVMLNAARDRGVDYRPPSEHLGKHLAEQTAGAVVPLALAYVETMLSEAEAM